MQTFKAVERPRLVPRAIHYPIEGEGVLLLTESEGVFPMPGRFLARVLPLLDGTRTTAEIARTLSSPAEVIDLYRALFLLNVQGLVVEGPAPESESARFWGARQPNNVSVRIETAGSADPSLVEKMLAVSGIAVDSDSPVTLVITDDYRQPALREINERHLREKKPWLVVKSDGWRPWIGPVFTPFRGPCWECLYNRLRHNSAELEFVATLLKLDGAARMPSASTAATRMLLALAVPVIERACQLGDGGELVNSIWTFDLERMRPEIHHVVHRPQCPACGDPSLAGGTANFTLQPRTKTIAETGYRTEGPWLTYERYRHHVSPISGAVPKLSPGLLDANRFNVVVAGANPSRKIETARDMMGFSLRSKAAGKGATREQALASALGEALERYSCIWRGDAQAIKARLGDLDGDGIDPRSILNFSERQYANRLEINSRGDTFSFVPEQFDPGQEIEWTPVRSLVTDRIRFVPTAMCWFRYSAKFVYADSNGCAAGNNLEEAILQGLCELVERDATAIWWYNQIPRPAIDLSGLNDPWCQATIEQFRRDYGRSVWGLDLTSDFGIPTAAVVSALDDCDPPEYFFGLGCHLNPSLAVRRAFTEMCQFFGGVEARIGRTQRRLAEANIHPEHGLSKWIVGATRTNHPQMIPLPGAPLAIDDLPRLSTSDLVEDIKTITLRLAERGHDVLALDCTQPDVGMPTARVFVPGLRHFWARFGPGRLYDVPVELGWLPAAKSESELNPVAMFF